MSMMLRRAVDISEVMGTGSGRKMRRSSKCTACVSGDNDDGGCDEHLKHI